MEVNEGRGDVLQVLGACEDPGVLDILEPVQGFVENPRIRGYERVDEFLSEKVGQ